MDVQKSFRLIAGLQEVYFGQSSAPTREPRAQLLLLLFVAVKVDQQVDVAVQPRGTGTCAAKEVDAFDGKAFISMMAAIFSAM